MRGPRPVKSENKMAQPTNDRLARIRFVLARATGRGPRITLAGTRWKNCASPAQNQLASEQSAFYQELAQNYATVFPEQQQILGALTSEFSPILAAGPSQTGFSPQELTSLQTEASDTTAQAAQQADVALQGKEAAMGGGEIPSGANLQLEAGLLNSAAQQNAGLQNQITQENYAEGYQNFLTAANELGSTASLENPNGVAGTATGAGNAANQSLSNIASENDSWYNALLGSVGGIFGAASNAFGAYENNN